MKATRLLMLSLAAAWGLRAADLQTLPEDPYFAPFKALGVLKAPPPPSKPILRPGDRLAVCGDSITEQKMYSRIIETYLTVCEPELGIRVRQFGWSGEKAPGFLRRMTNDVLRFHPTIATICYGMNDHLYRPYTEEIGRVYRQSSLAIIRAFKAHGVRVIQGAAGAVGKVPPWAPKIGSTMTDLNLGLLHLRNIDVELARQEHVGFADVFLPLLLEGYYAKKKWGPDYMLSGKDGVHPGWAGHLVMAYVFLKAMGLQGDLGTIVYDASEGTAQARGGHRVVSAEKGRVVLESRRYPFCASGPTDKDSSLLSGMRLVPFTEELNRLILIVRRPQTCRYKVAWGETAKIYPAKALQRGVNLAADFEINPFCEPFKRVDQAVAKKQAYETRQIKTLFHGPEGQADMEMTAELTEKARARFVAAIRRAFKPVRHTIFITPVD